MAYRIRRPYQLPQTTAWSDSLSPSLSGWDPSLGRIRCAGPVTYLPGLARALVDGSRLARAIAHLERSIDSSVWSSDRHLIPKIGGSAFALERQAAQEVHGAIAWRTRQQLANDVLEGFIDRIVQADRGGGALLIASSGTI
jgi:hypothetical protein